MTEFEPITLHFQIEQLVTTYNVAWDEGRFDDVVSCFTEDGTFLDGMGNAHTGRSAIKEFAERSASIFGNMRHLTTNHYIESNGEHWIHRCYLHFVSGIGENKSSTTGRYDDEFVVNENGPLFTWRRVYLD